MAAAAKHALTRLSIQKAPRTPLYTASDGLHTLWLLRSAQVGLRQPQHRGHCHRGVSGLQRCAGKQPARCRAQGRLQVVFVCEPLEGGVREQEG